MVVYTSKALGKTYGQDAVDLLDRGDAEYAELVGSGSFIRTPYARALIALLIMSVVLIGVVIIIYRPYESSSESSRKNAKLMDILKK